MARVLLIGGTGYLGSATLQAALEAGHAPVVLTRSGERARALQARGVETLVGDLDEPGAWAGRAEGCEAAVFVAAPPTWGRRVSRAVAASFASGLERMTGAFLRVLSGSAVKRAVYVAGTSYYGDAGDGAPRGEDQPGPPRGWGPYLAPAVRRVEAAVAVGAPVVCAFPGQVYGPASWMEQLYLRPLAAGKAVVGLRGHRPLFSPIHHQDCGRALVHLLDRGQPGGRYLLVDDRPLRARDFVNHAARALGTPLRTREVPAWLCRLLLGPVLTEYATAHTNFSNARLKATGFTLRYPGAEQGLPEVVAAWRRRARA